jgi:hypothetical protein
MILCSYGCGKEATYQLKNGKWCCSKRFNFCEELKRKISIANLGHKDSVETKMKKSNSHIGVKPSDETRKKLREAQTGHKVTEETKIKIRSSIKIKDQIPWNKGRTGIYSEETKRKIGLRRKGRISWNKGKHHTEKTKTKLREVNIGKKHTEETKIKMTNSQKGNKNSLGFQQSQEFKEKRRQYMLNGGSCYAASFIKNPSKPQVALYNLTKEIFPEAILNYPVEEANKNLDIAIPSLRISIEYDGSYWHQDKEYDNNRQKLLENLGWKFIRYIDYVPSKEQLEIDILKALKIFIY